MSFAHVCSLCLLIYWHLFLPYFAFYLSHFFPMFSFFCLPLKFFTYSVFFLLLILQDPTQVSWLVTGLVLEITATHCWRLGWRWDVAFLKGVRFAYEEGDETGRWRRSWLMDSENIYIYIYFTIGRQECLMGLEEWKVGVWDEWSLKIELEGIR